MSYKRKSSYSSEQMVRKFRHLQQDYRNLKNQVENFKEKAQIYLVMAIKMYYQHYEISSDQTFWQACRNLINAQDNRELKVKYIQSRRIPYLQNRRNRQINDQINKKKMEETKKLRKIREEYAKKIQGLDIFMSKKFRYSNWMDLDSIQVFIKPRDLPQYLGRSCNLASKSANFIGQNRCAIVNSAFLVSIKVQEREKFIQNLSNLIEMQPSNFFQTTTKKTFILPVFTIIRALHEAKIPFVQISCHGLKDLWIDSHKFSQFIAQQESRFDFGATFTPNKKFFMLCKSTNRNSKTYSLFNKGYGNYLLKTQDYDVKVYNTIIHTIKRRSNLKPVFKQNSNKSDFLNKIDEVRKFVEKLKKDEYYPKTRIQVTIRGKFRTMQSVKLKAIESLSTQINRLFSPQIEKKSLSVQKYFEELFELLNQKNFSKMSSRNLKLYYNKLIEKIGFNRFEKQIQEDSSLQQYQGMGTEFLNYIDEDLAYTLAPYRIANNIVSKNQQQRRLIEQKEKVKKFRQELDKRNKAVRSNFESKQSKKKEQQQQIKEMPIQEIDSENQFQLFIKKRPQKFDQPQQQIIQDIIEDFHPERVCFEGLAQNLNSLDFRNQLQDQFCQEKMEEQNCDFQKQRQQANKEVLKGHVQSQFYIMEESEDFEDKVGSYQKKFDAKHLSHCRKIKKEKKKRGKFQKKK